MKIYEQTFDQPDVFTGGLEADVYELCYFVRQNMRGIDLSNVKFIECTFLDCDLSNAIIGETAFQEVTFENCKMLGLRFNYASSFLLQLRFKHCQLDFCDFSQLNLAQINFGESSLSEANFTEANLSEANFSACQLDRAIFQLTNLSGADFRTAQNIDIDPENNQMRKAKFSIYELAGLLRKHGLDVVR